MNLPSSLYVLCQPVNDIMGIWATKSHYQKLHCHSCTQGTEKTMDRYYSFGMSFICYVYII